MLQWLKLFAFFYMTQPLISVIVPVYGTEPYLAKCLASICAQTYRNLEIICVDDGSPDASIDILQDFASRDDRVRVIRQANQGQAAARNAGLFVASGEWVTFVDSDDWIESGAYEACMLRASDEVDMVMFDTCVHNVFPPENPFYAAIQDNCKCLEHYYSVKYDGVVNFSDEVILNTNVCVWNKVFRASVLRKYNLLFPSGRWYEDTSFWYGFCFRSRSAYYLKGSAFYHYQQREDSLTHATRQKTVRAIDHLEIICDIYEVLKSTGELDSRRDLLAGLANSYIREACLYVPEDMLPKVMKRAWAIVKKVGVRNYTDLEYIGKVCQNKSIWYNLSRFFHRSK